MKIITWNINGIRALVRKDLLSPFVTAHDPDVLCLQETKAPPEQLMLDLPSHPYQYWNMAERKGYAGTAIVSKTAPLTVHYGLGVARHDREGRIMAAEFDEFFVVSVYVPNAKRDLSRLAERQNWDRCLRIYLRKLARQKGVVCGGDFNVAHTAIDLARPKDNEGQHGFTLEERTGFQRLLKAGFVDAFRHLHPDVPHHYTWWRQFGGARERNIGWRIDYLLVSQALVPRLSSARILAEVYGSDHCPVAIEIQ
jgi:exodeoxyribonuclease III